MKNPFLKYINKPEKDEVFHSSAFAKAQNAGNIGAASSETFTARRSLDQNRQFVRGYNDSRLVNTPNPALRAKAYDPTAAPRFTSRTSDVQASMRAATAANAATTGINRSATLGTARPSAMGAARPAAPAMSRPPMPKNPGIHR